jgi:endonuclease/exonuclease/phosphatase family metal-dependent hydrolase
MLRIATQNLRAPEHGDSFHHRWKARQKAHVHLMVENRYQLVGLQELTYPIQSPFIEALTRKSDNWEVLTGSHGNAVAYQSQNLHPSADPENFIYPVNSEQESAFTVFPFTEIGTKVDFTFITTHIRGGDRAVREQQLTFLAETAQTYAQPTTPVLIAGDFNSISTVDKVFQKYSCTDLWEAAVNARNRDLSSYQGWHVSSEKKRFTEQRVDSVFGYGDVAVVESGVTESIWHGVQASDHNAVWCDVLFNRSSRLD